MIQILGLRDRIHPKTGKLVKHHAFYSKGWRLPNIQAVFDPAARTKVLSLIPDKEKYNIYFTVAECFDPPRQLKEQWAIPFDIDGMDLGDNPHQAAWRAVEAVAPILEVDPRTLGVIFSGNGVQFFALTTDPIRSEEYFDIAREAYGFICRQMNQELLRAGIGGKLDPSVWSASRLMRFPDTDNVKPNKETRRAVVLNANLEPHRLDLFKLAGITAGSTTETVSKEVLKLYPKPDSKAVVEGCNFLKWASSNQDKVSEPQWYAGLSIWSRLEDGRDLCHASSEKHPGYSFEETEMKIDQSLASSGPRTCKDIGSRWTGCAECPHYSKVTSPIMIRSAGFLTTKETGFRKVVMAQDGSVKPGKPHFDELIQYFAELHPFISLDSRMIMVFNGTHFEIMKEQYIHEWSMQTISPAPSSTECLEFLFRLRAVNVRSTDALAAQADGKLNFKNCVLHVMTGEVFPHSPEHGFVYVLPFEYRSDATAPRWEQFLREVTDDNPELIQVLKEFGGYAISGDKCWVQKGLILYGDGANGKSIYAETLAMVVGKNNCSAIPMQDLKSEYARFDLFGKLFNYSGETSRAAVYDSEIFKALTDGSRIRGREPFGKPLEFDNRAKIINLMNHLPESRDTSYGFERRNLIVPFEVIFTEDDPRRDPFLKEKLEKEIAGICNSLMDAYRKARAVGKIINPRVSQEKLDTVMRENSPVAMFFSEKLEIVGDVNSPEFEDKTEIFQSFVMFCREKEFRPTNDVHFWRQAKKYVPELSQRTVRQERGGKRIVAGVKLNKEV